MIMTKSQLAEIANQINIDEIVNNYLGEAKQITTVEDFFDFLATNPKAGSVSFVYYTSPVSINKNLEGRGKNAIKNPMYSEDLDHAIIFKSQWFSFSFGELYANKIMKFNPDWNLVTGKHHWRNILI